MVTNNPQNSNSIADLPVSALVGKSDMEWELIKLLLKQEVTPTRTVTDLEDVPGEPKFLQTQLAVA